MEHTEYKKMFLFEQNYWWYKGMRLFINKELKILQPNKQTIKILDAGCGTGGNLQLLKKMGFRNLYGFDINKNATYFCYQRGFINIKICNINKIKFSNNMFDIIICVDVLESASVNEQLAYQELLRILKPNGSLILILPAFQTLLSDHDKAVHCVRRYNKKTALKKFTNPNVKIQKINYRFSLFFPILVLFKLSRKFIKQEKPKSDLINIPKLLNKILFLGIIFENKLNNYLTFPYGTSLFLIIKKQK